jgi:hypothetical protein
MWLAASAFAASWFLPVLDGMAGWSAFRAALAPLIPLAGSPDVLRWDDAIPQVLSALTNLMFLVLFGLWLSRQMFKPSMFVKLALACLLLDLYWVVQAVRAGQVGDLLYGYYVWLLAFALMLAAALVNAFSARRTSRTPTAGRPS